MMKRLRKPQKNKGKLKPTDSGNPSPTSLDYPIFCFKYLHKNYCISSCDKDDKIALINRIEKLSTMKWSEIINAPRHGFGSEKIKHSCIKPGLPPHISPDAIIIALRFNGRKPFIGHKEGALLHILFIDHNFSVYDHG